MSAASKLRATRARATLTAPGQTRLRTPGLIVGISLVAASLVVLAGPLVAVGVAAGLGVAAITIARPGLLLGAYLLIPFYKGAIQPFLPADLTVLLAALNTLQFIALARGIQARTVSVPGIGLWLALACLVVGGTLYAPDPSLAFGTSVKFLTLVTVPILGAGLRVGTSPSHIRDVLWAFFGVGVLVTIVGVLNFATVAPLTVLGMNTIQVGVSALLLVLIGTTFVVPVAPAAIGVGAILLMPVAVVVAIASGSRGPLLFLIVLAALAGIQRIAVGRRISSRSLAAIGWLIAIGVGVVLIAPAIFPAISTQRFTVFADFVKGFVEGNARASAVDTSSSTRVRLFGVAISMFGDHPLLGAGTSSFETLSPRYVGSFFADVYPHDSVLQIAAEFGIVGLVVVGSIALIALRRRLPPGAPSSALRAVFVYLALNSLVSGDILEDRMTWGVLFLILATRIPAMRRAAAGAPQEVPSRTRGAPTTSISLPARQ